jgi:hypothetical protein
LRETDHAATLTARRRGRNRIAEAIGAAAFRRTLAADITILAQTTRITPVPLNRSFGSG